MIKLVITSNSHRWAPAQLVLHSKYTTKNSILRRDREEDNEAPWKGEQYGLKIFQKQ